MISAGAVDYEFKVLVSADPPSLGRRMFFVRRRQCAVRGRFLKHRQARWYTTTAELDFLVLVLFLGVGVGLSTGFWVGSFVFEMGAHWCEGVEFHRRCFRLRFSFSRKCHIFCLGFGLGASELACTCSYSYLVSVLPVDRGGEV